MSSLVDRIRRALRTSPRGLAGTVADLLAIGGALTGGWVLVKDQPAPQQVLAVVISGLAVVFLVMSFHLHQQMINTHVKYARHVRDVSAMPKLADAASHLAQAIVAAEADPTRFLVHLNDASRLLAEMYGIAAGTPCRVTILEAYSPEEQRRPGDQRGGSDATGVAVRQLAASYPERRTRTSVDWVEDNTDFFTILRNGDRHFLNNDLPGEMANGYKNSHWPREQIAQFQREDSWPYRSTIVWPIQGLPYQAGGHAEMDLAGFLCVDATPVDTFRKDFDVPTGESFAHALYSGLATYRASQQPDPKGEPVTSSGV